MSISKTRKVWEEHYTRSKSRLSYPDENLVRILAKLNIQHGKALDFGAGSGRHSLLLQSFGYEVTALDYSENSLAQIRDLEGEIETLLCIEPPFPISEESLDLIVSWGVLHYNPPSLIDKIVLEYHRMLKPGGYLAGSIRADRDTHLGLQKGNIGLLDLKGAGAGLFSQEETRKLLNNFSDTQIGYMERTPIGKLEERICHWIFLARK